MTGQAPLFGPVPTAVFSDCKRYRYVLSWPTCAGEGVCVFVLANPSTATAEHTDPTVNRCIHFARKWGFAWCVVVNVRAWRETDPRKVPADPLAIGPDNDQEILRVARNAELVVCGWGKLGGERGPVVLELLRGAGVVPHALRLNADGTPGHPLYLRGDLRPVPMRVP